MKLTSQRTYALIAGGILFALGFFGFAFRTNFNVPSHYLVGSLVLGFWGIVSGVNKNNSVQ